MNNKLSLKHFYYLLDDFGIWQHTKGNKIDKKMGYALDDAARALVFTGSSRFKPESKVLIDYIQRSLENDSNFFDPKRQSIAFPISSDALGQSYWACALCSESNIYKKEVGEMSNQIKNNFIRLNNIRGKCYAILGSAIIKDDEIAQKLLSYLKKEYKTNSTPDWHWPERHLTYGNAIIPLAFLTAGKQLNDNKAIEIGKTTLDFLNKRTIFKRLPIAIGNKDWYFYKKKKSLFDQQPIDPAYQVLANLKAYDVFREKQYLDSAKLFYSWFLGNNIANEPLVDFVDGSCRDGIAEDGLSKNKGAENVVCFLLAHKAINEVDINLR